MSPILPLSAPGGREPSATTIIGREDHAAQCDQSPGKQSKDQQPGEKFKDTPLISWESHTCHTFDL